MGRERRGGREFLFFLFVFSFGGLKVFVFLDA